MKYLVHFAAVFLLSANNGLAQEAVPQTTDPAVATEQTTSDPSPLDSLRWMIGEWADENAGSKITCKCTSYGERGFLKREYRLQIDGQTSMEVVQMIGFDPILETITSWTFDTEGGYGRDIWTQDGDRWIIKTSFQLATGETASATNVITKVDENTVRWKSVNRQIGDAIQPSIPDVTIVRVAATAEKK